MLVLGVVEWGREVEAADEGPSALRQEAQPPEPTRGARGAPGQHPTFWSGSAAADDAPRAPSEHEAVGRLIAQVYWRAWYGYHLLWYWLGYYHQDDVAAKRRQMLMRLAQGDARWR